MTNNSTERNFWSAMVTAVKATTDLSYVQTWIDGARNRIFLDHDYPLVIFQPVRIQEDQTTNFYRTSRPVFRVIGVLSVGDADTANENIFQLDEDLKNAIENHLTSTSRVYELETVDFQLPENIQAGNDQKSVVACVIEVKILDNINFVTGQR
jgi:hypothetical protein